MISPPSWPTFVSRCGKSAWPTWWPTARRSGHLAPASHARKLGALKSLSSFGHRIGYLLFDIGAPLRLPAVKSTLGERILGEDDVHRLPTLETHSRNHALLRLFYTGALRISELCALTWHDLQPRDDAGQITIFGKGGKTRAVLVTPGAWTELVALRGGAGQGSGVSLQQGRPSLEGTGAPDCQAGLSGRV